MEDFTQKSELYIKNLREVRELTQGKLDLDMDDEALLAQIQANSARSYARMQEDNRLLDELLYSRKAQELTDADIAELNGFANKLFDYNSSEDIGLAYKVYCLLLAAARARKNTPMLIKELYYCGVCLFYVDTANVGNRPKVHAQRMYDYFGEAASYSARYEQFDKEICGYIMRCFGNLRLNRPHTTREENRSYITLCDRILRVFNTPRYREHTPDLPWDRFIETIYTDQYSMNPYLASVAREQLDPEIVKRYVEAANLAYGKVGTKEESSRTQNWRNRVFWLRARYYSGEIDYDALISGILDDVERADVTDYSEKGVNQNLMLFAQALEYDAVEEGSLTPKTKERLDRMLSHTEWYLENMPVMRQTRMMNRVMAFIADAMARVGPFGSGLLINLLLTGHKATYIHSLMVAELTRYIIKYQLDAAPEGLLGLQDCQTVEQLRARTDELTKLAYDCGLYHDIGKNLVLMYITTNARRLTDEEFDNIKLHAQFGYYLLERTGSKEDLGIAALYHHCFYDGTGGYPFGSGPCPSEMKPIVDVLSVADSLDAATDGVGRCYTLAKPYDKLIDEVRAQSGTRYSPVVAALFDDEAFYNSLKEHLYKVRNEIYVRVYRASSRGEVQGIGK